MLQTFHKYQKSVFAVLMVLIVSVAMLVFGVNPYDNNPNNAYAIKVNEIEISQNEFFNQRENLENRYREQFGNFYQQFLEMTNTDLTQVTIDNLVNQELYRQLATKLDLFVSEKEVVNTLQTIFADNFSEQAYSTYLKRTGQSSKGFEEKLRKDLKPQVLQNILKDHTATLKKEIEDLVIKDNTLYSYSFVNFNPESFEKDVTKPTDEELKTLYEQDASEYEVPKKIKYNYIVIDPSKNLDLVQVEKEDIELYYSERQNDYTEPEQVKARQIVLNFNNESIEEQIKTKGQAEEIIKKISEGEDFVKFVKEFSEDKTSKEKDGDLGWVKRGAKGQDFDTVAFSLDSMGQAQLITNESDYTIIRVEDHKPEKLKELGEVEKEIETILKTQDAPAYSLIKAQDLFSEWANKEISLADFAKEKNEEIKLGSKMLLESEVEDPLVTGLTSQLINNSEQKQLVEIGDLTILAEIIELKESYIPDMEEVKEAFILSHKQEESKKIAETKANEFLANVNSGKDFVSLAKELGLALEAKKDLKRQENSNELSDKDIKNAIFGSNEAKLIERSFLFNNNYYVFSITKIEKPSKEEIEKEIKTTETKMIQQNQDLLIASILNKLKAESIVEIAPGLVNL